MRKKLLLILCILICILTSALAEPTVYFPDPDAGNFIHIGDYGLPIAKLLRKIGYDSISYGINNEPFFDDSACEALIAYQKLIHLVETGYFDAETLYCILETNRTSEEIELVWIPMHGGKKYHGKENCSNMNEPRQVPWECALELDFSYCKRCWKYNPYP